MSSSIVPGWPSLTCSDGDLITHTRRLRVRHLFSVNPEIDSEYRQTYGDVPKFVDLHDPQILNDDDYRELWVQFSVLREDLQELRFSRPKLLKLLTSPKNGYHQVRSKDADLWTFELEHPIRIPAAYQGDILELVETEIRAMNLVTNLQTNELSYVVPIQTNWPIRLPQIMVLYTLLFWLGSLVRYDPHSVARLQEGEHWMLIDGFINQSRLWLLDLFEWELYQCETTLYSVR